MDNNYAIFYITDKDSTWQSKRLDLPINEWENYCKEQGYFEYDIKNLSTYSPFDLHLLTDIVYFENKYYLPNEEIPYPEYRAMDIEKFEVDFSLDEEFANDETDYDEVYNKNGISWGFGYLWTTITTQIILPDKTVDLSLIAQELAKYFSEFLEELEKNNYAVYINMEYSKFKWLAWIKDNKVRLIHQNYEFEEVKTEFDVLVDKDWFFQFGQNMIATMQKYADKDLELYNKYVKEKYNQ